MRRLTALLVIALTSALGVLFFEPARHFTTPEVQAAAVAGGGIPVSNNVTNSAGGTPIFLANANRRFLFCQNIGTTNAIYVTWGQTATATNGYLLAANGGTLTLPQAGCNSAGQGTPPGNGCVPTGAINAIAAASGTNTLVCDED
jgi:hypothetical protein